MQKVSSVSRVQAEEDEAAAAQNKGLLPPAVASTLPFFVSFYLALRFLPILTGTDNYLVIAPCSLVFAFVASILFAVVQTLATAIWRVLEVDVFGNELYANLPRPQGVSTWPGRLIFGDFAAIRKAPPAQAHLEWSKELDSHVYIYRGILYTPRILIGDATAMLHILSSQNCYEFPKPRETRKFLADLLGFGLVTVEGDVHKKHRKITAPAFSVSAVRSFVPTFWKNANGLVEGLVEQCDKTVGAKEEPFVPLQTKEAAKESRPGQPVLDVSAWLGRCTLDIIGQVGFGYQFNAVSQCVAGTESPTSLSEKVDRLLGGMTQLTLVDFLRLYLQNRPGLMWTEKVIPPSQRRKNIIELGETFAHVGGEIVSKKKEEILKELKETGGDGKLDKASVDAALEASAAAAAADSSSTTSAGANRDLLHRVIMASLASDVPAKDRLDDEELVGEMMSFLLAGHETTSTLTQWALWRLASRPDVVAKLREEIAQHADEDDEGRLMIDHDVLNTEMPYLDAVTKETLRLHAPVTSTNRIATRDCVIPLGKAYPGRKKGTTVHSIPLKKGQEIMIPIQVINSSTDLWGPTAHDFNPERWFSVPKEARESGLPLQLMTFISGARSCVGSRMAQLEFKVLLCALLDRLDFERVEGWGITARQGVVTRGVVEGQEEVGTQMPLRIGRRNKEAVTANGSAVSATAAA